MSQTIGAMTSSPTVRFRGVLSRALRRDSYNHAAHQRRKPKSANGGRWVDGSGGLTRWGLLGALLVASALVTSTRGRAQSSLGEYRRQTTRADLEKSAEAEEKAAAVASDPRLRDRLLADANDKRQRLKNGDFLPGDRIWIQVYADSVVSDTFTVRNDRMLRLPPFPDVSLQGVLDSELQSHLAKALKVYLKGDVQVEATALVQLTVLGSVGRPGFLTVPVDTRLTDVIMGAGGPGTQADLDRTIVKRGSQTVVDQKGFQEAIRLGKTVGDVSIRDGDQIVVPDQASRFSLKSVAGTIGALGGLFWIFRYGIRRR